MGSVRVGDGPHYACVIEITRLRLPKKNATSDISLAFAALWSGIPAPEGRDGMNPQKLAFGLLRLLAPAHDALAGDLLEQVRRGRSRLWLWRQLIG